MRHSLSATKSDVLKVLATLLAGFVAAMALSACSSSSQRLATPSATAAAGGGDPASQLRAAARATAATRSFQVVATSPTNEPTTFVYQAPDRIRSTLVEHSAQYPAGVKFEVISIGASEYQSDRDRPGKYHLMPHPGGEPSPAQGFLGVLQAVERAEDVRRDGQTYHFRTTAPNAAPAEGEAQLDNGLLQMVVLRFTQEGEQREVHLSFSSFNTAPPVERPAANDVLPG